MAEADARAPGADSAVDTGPIEARVIDEALKILGPNGEKWINGGVNCFICGSGDFHPTHRLDRDVGEGQDAGWGHQLKHVTITIDASLA
jgi:hypothetical protein